MRDRLTKKRVHVDYEEIVDLLGLSCDFIIYRRNQINSGSFISRRRCAYNFLRTRNVDFYWCQRAINDGCKNIDDLLAYCGSPEAVMEYCYAM